MLAFLAMTWLAGCERYRDAVSTAQAETPAEPAAEAADTGDCGDWTEADCLDHCTTECDDFCGQFCGGDTNCIEMDCRDECDGFCGDACQGYGGH